MGLGCYLFETILMGKTLLNVYTDTLLFNKNVNIAVANQ